MWLSGNQLTIPPELASLPKLSELGYGGGEVPVPAWMLDHIKYGGVLDLSDKDLGGEIPAWVYQFTDLQGLNLANCGLTGAIPPELGQLTKLTSLRLDGNKLAGELPRALRELPLKFLALDPSIGGLSLEQQWLVARSAARPDDEIAGMIAAGESKTIEFKETLRGLRGDGKPEHAVLKSIAGLLNTVGGHLFVGIRDDGGANGIDDELKAEFKDSEDEVLQYLANVIKDRMTPGVSNRVHPKFHAHRGVRILVIRCDQSPDQVDVREADGRIRVYARHGPTTRPLESHEVMPHFNRRGLQPGTTESDE